MASTFRRTCAGLTPSLTPDTAPSMKNGLVRLKTADSCVIGLRPMTEYLCDTCGHPASDHDQRMSDSALAPCHHHFRGEVFNMPNGGRFIPGRNVICGCEDFESEAADERA